MDSTLKRGIQELKLKMSTPFLVGDGPLFPQSHLFAPNTDHHILGTHRGLWALMTGRQYSEVWLIPFLLRLWIFCWTLLSFKSQREELLWSAKYNVVFTLGFFFLNYFYRTGSISHKNSTKAAGLCFTLIQILERSKDLFRLGCAGVSVWRFTQEQNVSPPPVWSSMSQLQLMQSCQCWRPERRRPCSVDLDLSLLTLLEGCD